MNIATQVFKELIYQTTHRTVDLGEMVLGLVTEADMASHDAAASAILPNKFFFTIATLNKTEPCTLSQHTTTIILN